MRISTLSLAMGISLANAALAEPLFQTSGAVFSNFDSFADLSPQIVLGFIFKCTNVMNIMIPDDADCLFHNFIGLQFPGDAFGESCSPPNIPASELNANLQLANELCMNAFGSFLDDASSLVQQVFEAESCWSSLCESNDAILQVESQYLEECTGVDLPYPLDSTEDMVLSMEEEENAILTCMLEYVMSTPALDFGFSEPPVDCWPPAYDNMGTVCADSLAKPAYEHCTENNAFFENLEQDMMFMSMDMSMKTDDGEGDDDMLSDDMLLLERFCTILDGLTTDKGLECLGIICNERSAMPSGTPSEEWSSMPSGMPSETPSSMPSDSPSAAPSASPSKSPTSSPSSAPSESPSSAPTLEELQYIVEVDLLSEFTVDMSASNVPDLLEETSETTVANVLSSFGNDIDVTVVSIAGNTLRRRLQNAVPVQFTVKATKECYHSDCNVFAENLIARLNSALSTAVLDGSMTTFLRQAAVSQSVDELYSATTIASSYRLISSKSQLNDPVIVSNPEEVQSAASLVSTVTSLALLMVSLVAL